jgi:hypothetical protein
VPDGNDPATALPADARRRLDAFTEALERVNVGDLSLYAIPGDEAEIDRARQAAHDVARQRGLAAALEAARHEVVESVADDYRGTAARLGYVGGAAPTVGFGADDDRLRVMQSLADAVMAIVLGDALDEADRGELLGGWDGLLPGDPDADA